MALSPSTVVKVADCEVPVLTMSSISGSEVAPRWLLLLRQPRTSTLANVHPVAPSVDVGKLPDKPGITGAEVPGSKGRMSDSDAAVGPDCPVLETQDLNFSYPNIGLQTFSFDKGMR